MSERVLVAYKRIDNGNILFECTMRITHIQLIGRTVRISIKPVGWLFLVDVYILFTDESEYPKTLT